MAEHVARIMAGAETSQVRPALVERIAALPPSPRQRKSRCHWSFASKLAHFFISTERFPIYDGYAVRMVAYHLGRRGVVRDTDHPYQAYVDNVERLRERSGLVWMGRELDRYLWLAGLYRVWKRKPTARINSEVRRFIEAAPRDRAAQADLAALGA